MTEYERRLFQPGMTLRDRFGDELEGAQLKEACILAYGYPPGQKTITSWFAGLNASMSPREALALGLQRTIVPHAKQRAVINANVKRLVASLLYRGFDPSLAGYMCTHQYVSETSPGQRAVCVSMRMEL